MTDPARLVVLISGSGSNLQAILDSCQSGQLHAQVVGVVSNKADAYGLQRAAQAGIPARVLPFRKGQHRQEYDCALAQIVSGWNPDWVILAGWMRLLSQAFLSQFPGQVINLHPALPDTYPGTHAIERAWADWQAGKIDAGGVMVHMVPDEGVDNGPLLNQQRIPFQENDTLADFEARVHAAEHTLLVETICRLIENA